MAKKKQKKLKKIINIRTVTTSVSICVFFLLAGIVSFTAWFLISTLNAASNPPILTDTNEGVRTESINVQLLSIVEGRLDEKTSRTVSDPDGQRNPFLMIRSEPESLPEESSPPEESPILEPPTE